VLEWCHNPNSPHDERCDCRASRGAECRKVRMVSVRGGCYFQAQGGLTVSAHSPTLDRVYPSEAFRYVGFRIVRSVP
jgi:formylglycine-generating enzyme required for sulfatase activity